MKTKEEELDARIRGMQAGGCIPNFEEDDFHAGNLYGFENGFKAGYEFAQQWINVNDELPEENVYVLVMQDDSDYTDIAYLEDDEWYYSNNDLQLSFNPTHWRNI